MKPHSRAISATVAPGRAWRHEGFIYLLAVNCTQKRQTATLSLSGTVELVASEFGPKPKVDAAGFHLDLPPIGYVMMKLKRQ